MHPFREPPHVPAAGRGARLRFHTYARRCLQGVDGLGGRSRRVPIASRVLPIVERLKAGKKPSDLLFTTLSGSRLQRSAVLRTMRWERTGRDRRIHDLRHTAACLWLARGVDVSTVQTWMGHASIATTNLYLHHLGTGADPAGLERLNRAPGPPGGHPPDAQANNNGESPG